MGLINDNVILDNKCESNVGGKMISNIGPDFDISGSVSFVPSKTGYGNAVEIDSNTELVDFTVPNDANFNTNKFIIEHWVYLNGWSIVNGIRTGLSGARTFWDCTQTTSSGSGITNQGVGFGWLFAVGDSSISRLIWTITTGFNIPANTPTYLMWIGDRDHATKNLRLIIHPDGGSKTELTTNGSWANFDMTNGDTRMRLANNQSSPPAGFFPGWQDNPRWYKDSSQALIDAVYGNKDNPDLPISGRPFANRYNFEKNRGIY